MNIPEPTTDEQKELYNAYRMAEHHAYMARQRYLKLFPKEKPTNAYDMHSEEIMDMIDTKPPYSYETPSEYYARLKAPEHITARLLGMGMRDMGYERMSKRMGKRVYNVWALPSSMKSTF